MPKEKSYNPVQAQHKADKAKAIKKGNVPSSIISFGSHSNLHLQAEQKLKKDATRSLHAKTQTESRSRSMT